MFHRLALAQARRGATLEAMKKHGLSRWEARRRLDEPTDEQVNEVIQEKCVAFGVVPPSPEGRGAIGDGTIIQGIKEFCQEHPELVKAIFSALLLLVGL